ncbi:MAG: hypothetical protein ABJD13_12020 [Paracoccaceae bacterium]
MTSTPPANTLRDGNLKATIWQNEGDKGAYYSTTFSRIYKDDQGEYREAQSFSSNDLLRISELARQAHNQTNELRQRDYAQQRSPDQAADQVEQRLRNNRASRSQSRDQGRER